MTGAPGQRGSSGYQLANGDVLRMGEYHIVAALEARKSEDEPLPAVPTSIHTLRPLRRAADNDIGARLNLEELLVPVIDMDPVLPVSAYGQSVSSGSVRALARAQNPRRGSCPRGRRPPRQELPPGCPAA